MSISRIDCLFFAVFGLCVPQFACAATQPAPQTIAKSPGSTAPQSSVNYSLDTPIEIIAADPDGAAVLNKDIPGLLADSHYESFKGMNLKVLASLSGGKLDKQALTQTEADLVALRKNRSGD